MVKAKLNPALTQFSGEIKGLVFSQTKQGTIVATKGERRRPWSPRQEMQRRRMTNEAALYYHREMQDPAKNAHYRARAKELRRPVSAFVMGGYMKYGARFAEMEDPTRSPAGEALGRDGVDLE